MKSTLAAVAVGLSAAVATATPLPIGGTVTPLNYYPTSVNAATVVQPLVASNFSSANFSGTLLSGVVTNDLNNPFGANFLTFVYFIINGAGSTDSLGRFTVNGFGTFGTDVGMDPFGIGGGLIDAFENNRSNSGDELGWSFLNAGVFDQVGPGQQSSYFVVHTNATTFNWSTAAIIDGNIAEANAWAPLPTPGAGAALAMGLLASARRRTR